MSLFSETGNLEANEDCHGILSTILHFIYHNLQQSTGNKRYLEIIRKLTL